MNTKIKKSKGDKIYDAINYTFLTILLLIVLYPLYFILIASISDPQLVSVGKVLLIPKKITMLGYQKIFEDGKIWLGYWNTIVYTVLGTIVNVAMTISSGYALSRKTLKGRNFLMGIFTFTMFFGGGLIPTYLLVKQLGLMNSMWAMIIPSAVSVWNIIIARTFFMNSIPDELFDAAFIDGCGEIRFFFKMAIPLSKAIVAVMVLFYAVAHWNSYFDALIYLGNENQHPLQLILRDILIVNDGGKGMAQDIQEVLEKRKAAELVKYGVIVVSSIPVLILYPFLQRYFVEGVMIGSVKG